MKIPTLLFVVITGCCAKENLKNGSFIFYKVSNTAKAVVKPSVHKPLNATTVCLQVYTDYIHKDSFFKLQTTINSKLQFHLYQIANFYYIYIDGDTVSYQTSIGVMEWRLFCVSWDSSTGVIHFAVNGNIFPRRVLKRGFTIDPEVTAVLGESLASVGLNNIVGEHTFVGEVRAVHMWDSNFSPERMKRIYDDKCKHCNGNVISWKALDYELHGAVIFYKPD
ncbi:C-reactive protein-like [Eleutherodactylus coqui]|uniref:C-reactive protein-like n=1 Tax=Eleutherodactylus coqui TaxID=57060 RepID=UPI003461E37A